MYRAILVALAVGLVTGVLTQIGQSVLPDGIRQVANSISPWLTVAFIVGTLMPRPGVAALTGFLALALALVGYYAMVLLRFGYTGGGSALILWTVGSVLGGAVFGPAGFYWRRGGLVQRVAAIALLAGVFVSEGIYLTLILPEVLIGVGFAVAGLIVPLVLGRSWPERMYAWLGIIPALGLGAAGYFALLALSGLLA